MLTIANIYKEAMRGKQAHLCRVVQTELGCLGHLIHIFADLPHDGGDASMRIQHVHCRVAIQVQHLIKVEPAQAERLSFLWQAQHQQQCLQMPWSRDDPLPFALEVIISWMLEKG